MPDPTTPPADPATPPTKPAPKPIGRPGRSPAVLARLRELGVHPDFPLFPHPAGQWCKKVKGKLVYFGALADPAVALNKWTDEKDDLLAGRTPRPKGGGLTVRALANHFLTAKQALTRSSELTARSFQDYYDTCTRFAEAVGKDRPLSDLRPSDFDDYRAKCAEKWGPVALGNEIQRIRSLFKYGFDAGHMDVPIRFGPLFRKPKRKVMREARQSKPAKFFSAGEIRMMLGKADTQLEAMILLGINCGWGNTDIAELEKRHLDLVAGIADFPRPKTAIPRRATLWPETVAAIKAALKARPTPKDAAHAGLVFITKYGFPWKRVESVEDTTDPAGLKIKRRETDSVGLMFGRLLRAIKVKAAKGRKAASLKQEGRNFYALRHTFRTVAGETGDTEAVDLIMGHEDAGKMGAAYREWDKDNREGNPRLRKVTDHVHTWLYGTAAVVK